MQFARNPGHLKDSQNKLESLPDLDDSPVNPRQFIFSGSMSRGSPSHLYKSIQGWKLYEEIRYISQRRAKVILETSKFHAYLIHYLSVNRKSSPIFLQMSYGRLTTSVHTAVIAIKEIEIIHRLFLVIAM